ncbi:hypothetical protein T310_5270, partial [Rasamsonia emersonii CBS 393.64]
YKIGLILLKAMVTKSASNLSLVITTMEDFSASYLVEKKSIWESYIPFSNHMYDKEWARLVVHLVPTSPFNHPEGLEMLRDEIETFNPYMKLMRLPQWLADEPTRHQKAHSSIVIHLENEAMATRALKGGVRIAGVACRAATYCDGADTRDHVSGVVGGEGMDRQNTRPMTPSWGLISWLLLFPPNLVF